MRHGRNGRRRGKQIIRTRRGTVKNPSQEGPVSPETPMYELDLKGFARTGGVRPAQVWHMPHPHDLYCPPHLRRAAPASQVWTDEQRFQRAVEQQRLLYGM